MNRSQRVYYGAFLLSVFICWAPSKPLAYLAPPLALAWYIYASRSRLARRRCVFWLSGWTAFILLHAFFSRGFDLPAAFLAVLTYATFAVLFVIPNREIASRTLLARMLRVVAAVLVIESAWGIFQATYGAVRTGGFDLSNGDRVEGTIHPELKPDFAAGNQWFAANISFALLALFPVVVQSGKWRHRLLFGALVLVLASVMHIIIFTAGALILAYLIYRPPLLAGRSKVFVLLGMCAVPLLAFSLLSANFSTFIPIVRQALAQQSPKAVVAIQSATVLPRAHPSMLIWGLGPGQFSSRAALIASGLYLGGPYHPKPIPFISPQSSKFFRNYIEHWLYAAAADPYWGSSQKPYFSWMSVYTEMGIPAVLAVLWIAAVILWRVKQRARTNQELLFATALGAAIVLFLFLGIQDNYWEAPQALLIGAMVMKVVYATLFCDPKVGSHKGLGAHSGAV